MNKIKKVLRYLPLYLMLLPGCIYLIVNNYIPMGGIVLAFKKYNFKKGIFGSANVGFDNFRFLFLTKDAFTITRNTLFYNFVFIVAGTAIAVSVAILLDELSGGILKKIYQTAILFPYIISIVIISYLVYAFLNTETGFLNMAILKSLGKSPVSWYSTPKYWPVILTVVYIWKSFGYHCILYYSALAGVDREYYEAASIDGAGRWKRIWYITLPGLKPVIIVLTLLAVSKIFYSDFGLFYQVPLNQGALIDVTNTIDTYVYRGLMQLNNVGMSAAAGLYQSLVGFVLVLSANTIVKHYNPDSALF